MHKIIIIPATVKKKKKWVILYIFPWTT